MMKRILGYMGYPAQPQLDPLGPHYYVAGGAWGEAWSGLETPEMRSNLLGLYRLGDRLAGKIHKVIFATPGLDLDGIHKVAQGELSFGLLEQVGTCVSLRKERKRKPS